MAKKATIKARAITCVRGETSSTALAAMLGISTRRVQQLAQAGVLEKTESGRFEYPEAIHSYIGYLKSGDDENIPQLRARDIQSRIDQREQAMALQRGDLEQEIEERIWSEVVDQLGQYRSLIQKFGADKKIRDELNQLLDEACAAIDKKAK